MNMNKNVGGIDRGLRVAAGIVLLVITALGYIGPWGWLGVVPIITALISFCPLYTVLGISTCPVKKQELHFHENLPESFKNDDVAKKE